MSEPLQERHVVSKTCSRCKMEKSLGDFCKDKSRKDGINIYCKPCKNLDGAQYRETHKEEAAVANKQWHEAHKGERVAYYEAHKEQRAATGKRWNEAHKDYKNSYQKERKRRDPDFKTACNIRVRLYHASHGNYKAGSGVRDAGCSMEFLNKYLESKFWPDMTWENQGDWHIDHDIPLALFDLKNREQFLTANHYTNLQPLWWDDNLKKHDRLDWSPTESKHELPERLKR